MSPRPLAVAAISGGAVVATAAVAIAAVGITESPPGAQPAPTTDPSVSSEPQGADAVELASAFLDDWVDDGRVVRRDQGDDTVSEGQAYGLLAATVADDEQTFDEIWDWTTEELVRDDGLMAWRWEDGAVVDDEPASDADLDAARALVVAGDRFDRPDLTADGVQLAGVIADRLTVETPLGRILLPGLWAAETVPYAYNPSYASPAAFAVLGEATGDPRWQELQQGSAAATTAILDATDLPPDWAQVRADGVVEPMPGAAGTGDSVRYGYDAARLVLRYAESCDAGDRALAASVYPTLQRDDDLKAVLDLGGSALTEDRSPLALVARAAAAASAGNESDADDGLAAAEKLSRDVPTYYGRAWDALGSAMLTGDTLGGCAALEEPTP